MMTRIFRISDFGFRIFRPFFREHFETARGNSEFRIQNSEFRVRSCA